MSTSGHRALWRSGGCLSMPFAAWGILLVGLLPGQLPADNIMKISHGAGKPGDLGVEVIVTARNETPIHGYSVAVSFPPEVLELLDIGTEGTHVCELGPEYVMPRVDNDLGVAVLGVILEFEQPIQTREIQATGPTTSARIIARLRFNVRPGAPGGEYPVRLVDGIGTPAAYNRFTSRGTSIAPALEDGVFLVDGGNVLELESKLAIAGASPSVEILARARHPLPLDGFAIAIAYDCTGEPGRPFVLRLEDGNGNPRATFAGTDLGRILGSSRIEFFQTDIDRAFFPKCRSRTAAIFDYAPPFEGHTLPPAPDRDSAQTLMKYTFSVGALADDEKQWQDLTLEFLDLPGAINNQFLIGSESFAPRRIHGKIYFSQGGLRGRVVDSASGEGLGSVRVVVEPEGTAASSGLDGTFNVQGLSPGTHALTLSRTGYYTAHHEGIDVAGNFTVSAAGDLTIYRVPSCRRTKLFERGDSNNDGRTDLSDAIFVLNFLFQGSQAPPCFQAADINDDDKTDISDSIWLLNWLFLGGLGIPPPRTCGTDPNGGALPCGTSRCS